MTTRDLVMIAGVVLALLLIAKRRDAYGIAQINFPIAAAPAAQPVFKPGLYWGSVPSTKWCCPVAQPHLNKNLQCFNPSRPGYSRAVECPKKLIRSPISKR